MVLSTAEYATNFLLASASGDGGMEGTNLRIHKAIDKLNKKGTSFKSVGNGLSFFY